jgi:hypothetical protein
MYIRISDQPIYRRINIEFSVQLLIFFIYYFYYRLALKTILIRHTEIIKYNVSTSGIHS